MTGTEGADGTCIPEIEDFVETKRNKNYPVKSHFKKTTRKTPIRYLEGLSYLKLRKNSILLKNVIVCLIIEISASEYCAERKLWEGVRNYYLPEL